MVAYLEYIRKAGVLIEALPYIQRFRGEIMVVKFGGSVMEDVAAFESALQDLVFLECVGARPIIVHGGGREITARLAELGIETRFINGLRYTCEKTIAVVDEVLHKRVNPRLVNAIGKFGGKAAGLSGLQVLRAEKLAGELDLGFVGELTGVDPAPIRELLERNEVPVITPLARGRDGNIYNLNADIAASRIAQELKAGKLMFLSDVPGILRDPGDKASVISTLRIAEVEGLINQGIINGGMVPKIQSAMAALEAGCHKVHVIDARLQHSLLLEIFTDEGVGTQIIK